MHKKYLLRFTPLEPYFLGGENTFRVDERSKYFISSLLVPSATTILGTLRYVLLEQTGMLRPNGKYTPEQKLACDALIGAQSYCVGGENAFGKLKSISPIFLTDGEALYIKTPQNCKAACTQMTYQAMELSQHRYATSCGSSIRFPLTDDYSAKKPVSDQSYMRLSDGKIFGDLFLREERTGISKSKPDKAFFKKAYISLKEGYSFAVIAEIEADVPLHNTICYMGREKSAFLIQVEETELDIEAEIRSALSARTTTAFYYVFGDTFLEKEVSYSDFAMLQTTHVRMLQSKVESSTLKVTCVNDFYPLVRAGSVLYADDLHNSFETNFGYNKIIEVEV